jgi:chromosome segregation ATPase
MSSHRFFTASAAASALLAAAAVLSAAPALAQNYPNTNTPGIDNAQQAVNARIQQGMQQGRISPSEAQALYRRDREIEAREMRYKSDGRATPQERQQLRSDVASLSTEVDRLMARPSMNYPQATTPGIDRAEYNISQRIDEGLRTGRISQREAKMLTRQSRAIERHEASFKADGVVTQSERRQLRNELTELRDRVERLINPRG